MSEEKDGSGGDSPVIPFGGPGAEPPPPGDPGEIDEELAKLPPPKRRRSPIAALSIIALAGVLLAALRSDLRYALSPREPVKLGDARALSFEGSSPLVEERYAELTGQPDYRNALLFEPKGDQYRRAFFRMMGTQSRLWVRAEQTSTRSDVGGAIAGRLRKFDSLPYADQVRAYYADQVKTTRLLDLDDLKRELAASQQNPARQARDRAGEPVDVQGGGEVQVVVDFPSELLVRLPKSKFAVAEDAERELRRLGQPVGPVRESRDEFEFPVRIRPGVAPVAAPQQNAPSAPPPTRPANPANPEAAARNDYIAKLEAQNFSFGLRREPFTTTLAGLRAAGGTELLSIPSAPSHPPIFEVDGDKLKPRAAAERTEIPWSQIDSIQLASPIRIPSDAWVLVEGERPADFNWVPALAGVLALFALLNVWWLIRLLIR